MFCNFNTINNNKKNFPQYCFKQEYNSNNKTNPVINCVLNPKIIPKKYLIEHNIIAKFPYTYFLSKNQCATLYITNSSLICFL